MRRGEGGARVRRGEEVCNSATPPHRLTWHRTCASCAKDSSCAGLAMCHAAQMCADQSHCCVCAALPVYVLLATSKVWRAPGRGEVR